MSVWPGYITTVDVFEGGLYLQLDVAHRVLRTDTAYDLMTSLRKKSGPKKKGLDIYDIRHSAGYQNQYPTGPILESDIELTLKLNHIAPFYLFYLSFGASIVIFIPNPPPPIKNSNVHP